MPSRPDICNKRARHHSSQRFCWSPFYCPLTCAILVHWGGGQLLILLHSQGPLPTYCPKYQPVYREAKVWLCGPSEMAADHLYTLNVCPCPQCAFLRRCWVRVFPMKQQSLWLPWLNSAPLCQHRSVLPGLKPLKVSNPLCLALLVVLFITFPPLDS